jgi:hypothetical protein
MTQVKYRVRQLFATLTAMTADNAVLLEGERWIEKSDATGFATGRTKTGDGVTVFNDLPFDPGTGGGGGGTTAYVHTQSTPATAWTINHNLGFRPSVELLDSGSQEIDADVSHPSVNQTVVTLKSAIAGLARLI